MTDYKRKSVNEQTKYFDGSAAQLAAYVFLFELYRQALVKKFYRGTCLLELFRCILDSVSPEFKEKPGELDLCKSTKDVHYIIKNLKSSCINKKSVLDSNDGFLIKEGDQ